MTNIEFTKNNDFLRMALNETKSMIFVKDKEFRIIYANNAFLSLYPPEKRNTILGTTTLEKFPEEEVEGFLKEDRRALEGEETEIIEQVTDYAGKTRTLLTRKIGFTGEKGEPLMLGICYDVEKMVEQEKVLAEKNMALERFTTIAAHDLRSPLDTLISYMDLIKMDKDTTLSEESLSNLKNMRKSALLMMNQIISLVDLYKDNKAVEETCALNEILAEVKYSLSELIKKENAKILNSEMPIILGQPDLFRQLFQNLIENSLLHRSSKTPLITIKSIDMPAEYVFEIEDNGHNIPPQNDPFIVNNDTKSPKRTGIGLTLCRRIIDSFGGKIWLDHGYTDGGKICFSIPKDTNQDKQTVYI